jgi:hypothetical protein
MGALRSSELMFSLPNLDSTLNVLTAMITPAVMILATSSLILTTTNRLVRIVDRVREMLPEFETLAPSSRMMRNGLCSSKSLAGLRFGPASANEL